MRKQPHQQHHQHRYEDDAMMTTTSSSSSSSSLRSASPTSSSTTWTSSRRTKPLNNVAKLIAAIALALLACLPIVVLADEHSHEYESNDAVTIWLNKIGPYHNPQETYPYYFLPFCAPKQKTALQANDDSLSVMLEGDEVTDSGLVLRFRENVDMQEVCTQKIDEEAQTSFEDAIHSHFWYQMYIDELPVWGMVGEVMESDVTDADGQSVAEEMPFIYTHKDFSISYNGAHIIEVNLTSENPRPVVAGTEYPMTYSVRWQAVDTPFESRFDRYLDFDFFEHQIHWFSIFNSFMMVMFLCGLVAFILMRTLKNDYARYAVEDDDIELDRVVDESGWKQVHGDVFRAPPMLALFSALLGSGAQLASLTFALIVIALVGTMYDQRGSLSSAVLVVYCLTSVVSGYVSASTYKRYGGSGWKRTMLLTASLYPSLCFSLGLALNTLALVHGSTTLFTVNVIFGLFGIFLFISCPLVLLGTIMGRLAVTPGEFPCRINNLRRPIPDGKWYTRPWFLALCSGILPFGSIFIEMYFIFTSFWNYKFYYVYGFMFLVFTILFLVTVCVTIVSTYVLLNSEDYRWHWTSFGSGASTGIYMFLYAVFYFFQKTRMSGILQTCYYFGYMAAFSVGFAIMCGGISFLGAHLFVWRVYQIIKID